MIVESMPIAEVLPDILSALQAHSRLVLEAPPGAGKTTQVPIALLKAAFPKNYTDKNKGHLEKVMLKKKAKNPV